MKKSKLAAISIAALAVLAVSGCSTPTPKPTPTKAIVTLTPAQALANYKKFTKASCDAMQAQGIVETVGDTTLVLTRDAKAYHGFSAAYLEKPDNYELLYESGGLVPCADYESFSGEGGDFSTATDIQVTYDGVNDTYNVTERIDGVQYKTSNTIANGLIVKSVDLKNNQTTDIRYGDATPAEYQILVKAVTRQEKNN